MYPSNITLLTVGVRETSKEVEMSLKTEKERLKKRKVRKTETDREI